MNKLRFSTFDDFLNESTLSMHLKQKSIRNKDLDVSEVLSVSNQFGFISQKDQFNDREVASKDQTNYKLVLRDEYAYNPARINVGSIARLKDNNVGIISPMYVVFEVKKSLSKNYFDYFIKSKSFSDQMKTRLVGSVRQTLDFKSISSIKINLPSIKEQEKIGGFLSTFDKLIDKQQDKIGLLKELKKGYLQKMFPKSDANVPEIRFKGFTDAWEQYKLGDLGFFKSNGVDKLSKPNEIPVNLLNYMDVYNRRKVFNKNAHELMQVTAKPSQLIDNNVQKNDVFFTPTSETPEDIGRVYVIEETLNNTVYSYHLMRFRPNQGTYYPNFPNYSLMTENVRKKFFLAAKGVQRYVISKADFESIKDTIPEYREQAKIGEFFRSIDQLITLHQSKLDQLEILKKGYMQRLFA